MRASIPTLLLLASVAVAQDDSTTTSVSVVTSPFVSPSPTEEQIYTIQTDTASPSDPWACYEECFMEPCPPSPCSGSSIDTVTPVPLPRPVSESVVTEITDTSLSSVSGFMSIPQGETPITSGASDTSEPSDSPTASPTSASGSTATRTTSQLPQETSNAAAFNAKADQIPLVAAVAGALAML